MSESGDVHSHVKAYWNLRAQEYDADAGHGLRNDTERELWSSALRDLLPAAPSDVLDVGTGTGFLALLLADLGYHVVGIDLAEEMLAQARRKVSALAHPPIFQLGDAIEPKIAPSSMDVVINRHLLWTLTDPERALRNWGELLRPGGYLIAIDGLWYQHKDASSVSCKAPGVQSAWDEHYSASVRSQLPLIDAKTLEQHLALVRAAGFTNITVSRLEAIEAFESTMMASNDQPRQPRYVIRARHAG